MVAVVRDFTPRPDAKHYSPRLGKWAQRVIDSTTNVNRGLPMSPQPVVSVRFRNC